MIDKLLALQPNAIERIRVANEAELQARKTELRKIERAMIEPKGQKKTKQALGAIKRNAKFISENRATIEPAKSSALKFRKNFTALGKWFQDYVEINKEGGKRNDPYGILGTKVTEPVGSSTATMRAWLTGASQGIAMEYPVKERDKKAEYYYYKSNIVDPSFLLPVEKKESKPEEFVGGKKRRPSRSRLDQMDDYTIKANEDPRGWNFEVECTFPKKRETYYNYRIGSGPKCKTPAVIDEACLDARKIGTVHAMECNASPVPERVALFYKTANKLLDKFAGQIHEKIDASIQWIGKEHAEEMKELDEQIAEALAKRAIA